jgi:hypothetical protein
MTAVLAKDWKALVSKRKEKEKEYDALQFTAEELDKTVEQRLVLGTKEKEKGKRH